MEQDNDQTSQLIRGIVSLVWGKEIKPELFGRWSQGVVFSEEEASALVQLEGGPCAVLAPVQAFILKHLLLDNEVVKNDQWRQSNLTTEKVDNYLCQALCEILHQAATFPVQPAQPDDPSSPKSKIAQVPTAVSPTSPPTPVEGSVNVPASPATQCGSTDTQQNVAGPYRLVFLSEQSVTQAEPDENMTETQPNSEEPISLHVYFHCNIKVFNFETQEQIRKAVQDNLGLIKGPYGVLQFLYSVILTKGINNLVLEMPDTESLIDDIFGHGNQSLINLMLTGRGVANVCDRDVSAGGVRELGIIQRPEVGFLTVLECYSLITVGSFYKNPKYPIWVIHSRTHLTVAFSTNMDLVSAETPLAEARRVFARYDDGTSFIPSVVLENVMNDLGLFCETEYVQHVKNKLDPDQCDIILLDTFLNEFYPNCYDKRPDTFTVYHYNGLRRPPIGGQVVYHEGHAILLETELMGRADDATVVTCLQTNWPNIDIQWLNDSNPSIN